MIVLGETSEGQVRFEFHVEIITPVVLHFVFN
jgi:hypothetical protein